MARIITLVVVSKVACNTEERAGVVDLRLLAEVLRRLQMRPEDLMRFISQDRDTDQFKMVYDVVVLAVLGRHLPTYVSICSSIYPSIYHVLELWGEK